MMLNFKNFFLPEFDKVRQYLNQVGFHLAIFVGKLKCERKVGLAEHEILIVCMEILMHFHGLREFPNVVVDILIEMDWPTQMSFQLQFSQNGHYEV